MEDATGPTITTRRLRMHPIPSRLSSATSGGFSHRTDAINGVSPEALDQPRAPPTPHYSKELSKAYVGLAFKHVNAVQGWRKRLFVLHKGILRYYKISGPDGVQLVDVIRAIQDEGFEYEVIGLEGKLLEDKSRVEANGHGPGPHMRIDHLIARSETHMQVARVEKSTADSRKFRFYTGARKWLLLRVETEDRDKWLAALHLVMESFGGPSASAEYSVHPARYSNVSLSMRAGLDFEDTLSSLAVKLQELQAPQAVQEMVLDLMRQQQALYHAEIMKEQRYRRELLRYIASLEDDVNQLEAAVAQAALQGVSDDDAQNSEGEHSIVSALLMGGDREEFTTVDADGDEFFDPQEEQPSREASGLPPTILALKPSMLPQPQWLQHEVEPRRRHRLPPPKQKANNLQLWTLIKSFIGKDLSKVCLPVYFNEPLSLLQKMCEDLEYSQLLDAAVLEPKGSMKRLALVGAFAVSCYSSVTRTTKPFNPLLGETYELIYPAKGYRFMAEKVVHHPNTVAGNAQGRGWTFATESELKTKFYGQSIELRPLGLLQVTFDDGEVFQWRKVISSINNIILGKLYVDHAGVMEVKSLTEDHMLLLQFKQGGRTFSKNYHRVVGHVVKDHVKVPHVSVDGYWDRYLEVTLHEGGREERLWQCEQPPCSSNSNRYNFTNFAMLLNEVTPGLDDKLCPTDCRLRPDQRLTEEGWYDKADSEKQRLETKQRAARRAAEMGAQIQPRWFRRRPGAVLGEEMVYDFTGDYWEARSAGDFTGVRDIFGPSPEDHH